MPTRFRSFAELDTGERSYLFGFRRRPKIPLHEDARDPAYYLHHHKERVKSLAAHLTKRYDAPVDSHGAAKELGAAARNLQHHVKRFDKHDAEHHKALAQHAFRYLRSNKDTG